MKKVLTPISVFVLLCALGIPASAGWTVVNLNTEQVWPHSSSAYGVSDSQQVGMAWVANDVYHAGLWNGTAGSWVDLSPAGSTLSEARAISGGRQVGSATFDGSGHAGYWTGTAESWVDLHPAGAAYSWALGMWGNQQVGAATIDGVSRAGMWSGSAETWVDLHPAGASLSQASGISGSQQVGHAVIDGEYHASLWSGTADSWVDLNPLGATTSYAVAFSDGMQVGAASFGTRWSWVFHAGLWSGTAGSWVDMNPAGASASQILGATDGAQVGSAIFGDMYHAGMWRGTSGSWVDLHDVLPSGVYSSSDAYSLFLSAGETWIAGTARNASMERDEAILWHYTPDVVPEPSSLMALGGGLIGLLGLARRRKQ